MLINFREEKPDAEEENLPSSAEKPSESNDQPMDEETIEKPAKNGKNEDKNNPEQQSAIEIPERK